MGRFATIEVYAPNESPFYNMIMFGRRKSLTRIDVYFRNDDGEEQYMNWFTRDSETAKECEQKYNISFSELFE